MSDIPTSTVGSTSDTTHGNTEEEIELTPGTSESNPSLTSSHAWRYNFDFNPSWLNPSGTSVRELPAPISMFNEWVRTNISTTGEAGSQSSLNTSRSVASQPVDHSHVVNMTGSRPGLNSATESEVDLTLNSQNVAAAPSGTGSIGRAPRTNTPVSSSRTSLPQFNSQTEFIPQAPAQPIPTRRDSRPYVVDVESATEWSAAPEVDGQEEGQDPNSERSPAEIIRQSPEARAVLTVIERYAPFILILFVKGLFDHGSGLVCFFALLITCGHANTLVKKEVAKQSKRGIFFPFMISANLLICVGFMYYVFQDQKLYPALFFFPTGLEPTTVYSLLWIVCLTDYVAKFFTIIVKSCVIALPEGVLPFQKRGKYYLFIESSSQLYRGLLPLYPWLFYLFESYQGTYRIISIILCSFYLMCKSVDLVQRGKAWKIAFTKFLQPVHYGTSPGEDELLEAGVCPICHDTFNNATRLSCSHIFCEECVSTWFDRERTCPMCRTRVVDDPMYRDGSTTNFIQIY